MSQLDDDIARGCLENGEPIEARWGTGSWSTEPEQQQEPEWSWDACPHCGKMAHYYGGDFIECEECGRKGE